MIPLILAREIAPEERGSEKEQLVVLIALLPRAYEAWRHRILTEEGSRSETEIAASLPLPDEAMEESIVAAATGQVLHSAAGTA